MDCRCTEWTAAIAELIEKCFVAERLLGRLAVEPESMRMKSQPVELVGSVHMELMLANAQVDELSSELKRPRCRRGWLGKMLADPGIAKLNAEIAYQRSRADRAFEEGRRSRAIGNRFV